MTTEFIRENLIALIEQARQQKGITNDQARAASVALGLEGDESMLAARLMSGGADPASLSYLADGHVSPKVALAHIAGPGIFKADDPDRDHYLGLCALSADESKGSTLRGRVNQYLDSLAVPEEAHAALAADELDAIMALEFGIARVGSIDCNLRVYRSDRGFASAYWSGIPVAAVYFEGKEPYLYVCTDGSVRVGSLGLPLDKTLDDNRGIIEDAGKVAAIVAEAFA